jgi:transposase
MKRSIFRRVWRKVPIGVDGKGFIRASKMTTHKTDDRDCFSTLIDKVDSSLVNETLADSGYDSHNCYNQCEERNINFLIPPPKNARVLSRKGKSAIRNETVSYIREKGIHAWKEKNNFGRRNRVENTSYRIKTIFNRQFMSRIWENQEAETNLMCHLLNQRTSLGMPRSMKIA